jgi:hypothetical protein
MPSSSVAQQSLSIIILKKKKYKNTGKPCGATGMGDAFPSQNIYAGGGESRDVEILLAPAERGTMRCVKKRFSLYLKGVPFRMYNENGKHRI